jgi:undecaprenyl diphosphate synthase
MTQTLTKSVVVEGVPAGRMPGHIAIIMDGNGRWARQRGLPRFAGHRAGAKVVTRITEACSDLKIKQLTLYSFSTENWSRPADEVAMLMDLYVEYMRDQRRLMMDNNIRFAQIGRRDGLPGKVVEEMDASLEATRANTGMTLCLAVNYGSRGEIAEAVRNIAREVKEGKLDPAKIDEGTISERLFTAGMPDPDLLIRTAGEMRLSNYLLWQISYAEFYVTEVFWPEFTEAELHKAIRDYAGRNRRFGGVDGSNT